MLQLGTVGSRSTVKYGTNLDLHVGSKTYPTYLDVANFDRYDMVIGTPFLRAYNVTLDFGKSCVRIGDEVVEASSAIGAVDERLHRYRSTDKNKSA